MRLRRPAGLLTIRQRIGRDAVGTLLFRSGISSGGVMRRYERDIDGVGWHDGLLMDLAGRGAGPTLLTTYLISFNPLESRLGSVPPP